MRKAANYSFLGLTAIGLSLTPSLPAASQPRGAEPLCRRAPVLAPLPPEAKPRVRAQEDVEGYATVPLMEVPAPPPPPPPEPSPPPAPPPISGDIGLADAAEIAVTGSRSTELPPAAPVAVVSAEAARSEARAAPSTTLPPPVGPYPQPGPGILTAGDHDDLLNPELYTRYARAFWQQANLRDAPRVDTRSVLTVAVQDEAGRAVPFASVKLTCADGNSLSLATLADGTAVFHPELDRLGDSVRVSVSADGRELAGNRTVTLSGQPGAQRQAITVAARAAAVKKFDLLVAIDTTGSMGDEISFLNSELRSILDEIRSSHPGLDIRLGLVAYKDEGDDYVTRTAPFTSDLRKMQAQFVELGASGGGDYPEAMDQALGRAVALDWRDDAVKSLLLVADAPPHDQNIGRTWAAAEAARGKRIQIVPIAASGVAGTAEYVMRAMAAATQSRYIFLTDDSGVGNPHAPPAVDCYLVTKLNALVRRVLDSQISGRRVEPRDGEAIRSVGRYEGGKCILPPDFSVEQ